MQALTNDFKTKDTISSAVLIIQDSSDGTEKPTWQHGIILGKQMLQNSKTLSAHLAGTVFRVSDTSRIFSVVETALKIYTPRNPILFADSEESQRQYIEAIVNNSQKVRGKKIKH